VIIDERGQAPPGSAYQLSLVEVIGTGEVRARVNGPPAVSLGRIQFGSWHHVALRYDKSSLSLVGFLDGTNSLVATGDRLAPWEASHQWHLGFGLGDSVNLGSGSHFRGELDEIRIWKVARSDLDLRTHQFRALTGTENGLIAYWNLNDNTGGNVVLDSSGHNNHGTLVNGPMRVASTAPITTIVPILKRSNGTVLMQFLGVPWEFYDLQHSTNLLNWQTLQPLQAMRTGVIEFETVPGLSQQFFRAKSGAEEP
jgi:hypothetical protein